MTAVMAVVLLVPLGLTPAAASASVVQRARCTDAGGRTWQARAVWGGAYIDTVGVRRVHLTSAGWTTTARTVRTDSAVRSVDGSGHVLRRLRWTGVYDYRNGAAWRSRNPIDPPDAPGRSSVTVTVGVDGDGAGNCTVRFRQPGPAAGTEPVSGWWSADLRGSPLGSMGCDSAAQAVAARALSKQWDHWDNCGGSVVSPAAARIPVPPGGSRSVVRWRKPAGDANVYQKLNRTFTKDNWPPGGTNNANTGSPRDVSARYVAYLYIPSSDFVLNPGHGWAQLLQFKENYTDVKGVWHQDPLWAMGVHNFSGTVQGGLWPHTKRTFALSSNMDRWVRWELRLYQGADDTSGHGGRLELWADGKLLDTGYESERHVGSAALSPLSRTHAWVWIAGPYTSNQTTRGIPDYRNTHVTTYVGPSMILPLT